MALARRVYERERSKGVTMLDRLEILVEEPSMAEVLRGLLPGILPNGWELDVNCFIRPHEGKQDLQRSLPHKLAAACKKNIKVGFVVLQDQDSSDCKELKRRLVGLCEGVLSYGENVVFKIRIVCHELEAWYLGDMNAIERTFPRFHATRFRNKKLFRNPDNCLNPKAELKRIVGEYPQIATARDMAANMNIEENVSGSFKCFIDAILQMTR